MENVCCICNSKFYGYGNNPAPIKDEGRCCDSCNFSYVVPGRISDLVENMNDKMDLFNLNSTPKKETQQKETYKIIVSHSASVLTDKVNEMILKNWEPVGSHKVEIKHQQNRFRGQQHVDTLNELEYSQTMVKSAK